MHYAPSNGFQCSRSFCAVAPGLPSRRGRTALLVDLCTRHTGEKWSCASRTPTGRAIPPKAIRAIYDGLRWLGLDWDEGPDAGGECGPIFSKASGKLFIRNILKNYGRPGRIYERRRRMAFQIRAEARGDARRGLPGARRNRYVRSRHKPRHDHPTPRWRLDFSFRQRRR